MIEQDREAIGWTPEQNERAILETQRLCNELDITNADHIVLWLETNFNPDYLSYVACQIVDAHEAVIVAAERRSMERAAEIADQLGGVRGPHDHVSASNKAQHVRAKTIAQAIRNAAGEVK